MLRWLPAAPRAREVGSRVLTAARFTAGSSRRPPLHGADLLEGQVWRLKSCGRIPHCAPLVVDGNPYPQPSPIALRPRSDRTAPDRVICQCAVDESDVCT